jgi:hypothetical protein
MRTAGCACRKAAAIVLPAAAVLLAAACGPAAKPAAAAASGSPPAAAASPAASAVPAAAAAGANSCTVVTQAAAGAALGHAVKPPVRGRATVEGGAACVYYGPSAPAGANPDVPVPDSVRVVLVTGPKALRYFKDYRARVHAVPIAGLGDKAYYDGYASLSVMKGDEYLRIAVIGAPDTLGAEKRLAAAALPRM